MAENKPIKVILLGESGVGKTNLIRVSIGEKFEDNPLSTITSSYCEGRIMIDDKKYLYNLWDTAGQEKYRSLNRLFIKDSNIIIIVFAINKKTTFDQVDFWHKFTKEYLEEGSYILGLIGNKSDMYEEEQVSSEEIAKKAKELGINYKITSARIDPKGFKDFLNRLLEEYISNHNTEEYNGSISFQIGQDDDDKNNNGKKKCCLAN